MRRRARLDRDPDTLGARVAERVGGDERDRARRAGRPGDPEAAVLDEHRPSVRGQGCAGLEGACERERVAARDEDAGRVECDRRSPGVDREAPGLRRARAGKATRHAGLEAVVAVPEAVAVQDEAAAVKYASPVTSLPSSFQWTRPRTLGSAPTENLSEGRTAGPIRAWPAGPSASRLGAASRAPRANVAKISAPRMARATAIRRRPRMRNEFQRANGRCRSPGSLGLVGLARFGRRLVGRFVGRRRAPELLHLVDEQEDRPAARPQVGVRLVAREPLAPVAELFELSRVHLQGKYALRRPIFRTGQADERAGRRRCCGR